MMQDYAKSANVGAFEAPRSTRLRNTAIFSQMCQRGHIWATTPAVYQSQIGKRFPIWMNESITDSNSGAKCEIDFAFRLDAQAHLSNSWPYHSPDHTEFICLVSRDGLRLIG